MPRNAMSLPQSVSHVCPKCGPRIIAPTTSVHWCRCGLRCEIDVGEFVATMRAHYPDGDLRELAGRAQIAWPKVQAVLNHTEEF
jgi:endogenous inhibitor of DNA gyrase (YacG/DUF329 family)